MIILALAYSSLFLYCQLSIERELKSIHFYRYYTGVRTACATRAIEKLAFCSMMFFAALKSAPLFKWSILLLLPTYLIVAMIETKSEDTKLAMIAIKQLSSSKKRTSIRRYEMYVLQLYGHFFAMFLLSFLVIVAATSLIYTISLDHITNPEEGALAYFSVCGGALLVGGLLTYIVNRKTYISALAHIRGTKRNESA
jgi:uncharacterized membrane protein